MPGALVSDETDLGSTSTSVAVSMICKLLTEKIVMGLSLFILCRTTLEGWVNQAQNNYPRIIGAERKWYLLQRLNWAARHPIQIQSTPPERHPALTAALVPVMPVTIPGVASHSSVVSTWWHSESLERGEFGAGGKCESHPQGSEHQYWRAWKLMDYPLCSIWYHDIQSQTIKQQQTLILFMGFVIFDHSHRHENKHRVGWQIAMIARIRYKPQVIIMPRFYSHPDWWYWTMWQFTGVSEDHKDETLMEKHGAKALDPTVKSCMHAIQTEDKEAQLDAAHWMIQIASPWIPRRWSESKLATGKEHVRRLTENAQHIDLKRTAEVQSKLMTQVERYTS